MVLLPGFILRSAGGRSQMKAPTGRPPAERTKSLHSVTPLIREKSPAQKYGEWGIVHGAEAVLSGRRLLGVSGQGRQAGDDRQVVKLPAGNLSATARRHDSRDDIEERAVKIN